METLFFVRRSVRLSVVRSFLRYNRITRKQYDGVLAEELSLRAAAAFAKALSPTAAQDRLAKRQRLNYLHNLFFFDSATAKTLACTASPVLSSSFPAADTAMPEISGC
ncbi:hypothetical protein [Parasitella parasitica]|uniref:Uncharacterized protein n=1 Tax=Parasitella parasitica TaxID=35722 RepID=A0A0B7MVN1_9FUNG|nr:hypothetical protein [Parasitella parasitica]